MVEVAQLAKFLNTNANASLNVSGEKAVAKDVVAEHLKVLVLRIILDNESKVTEICRYLLPCLDPPVPHQMLLAEQFC